MKKIVNSMKARNSKENMKRTQAEVDAIVEKLTGKKKSISMYQIERQLREQF